MSAGRGGELGGEVLLLPLREADDHRIVRADRGAHGLQDLGGEAGALADGRAAEQVAALVGAVPEELVDQVAVRAVQLDRVEAERAWRLAAPEAKAAMASAMSASLIGSPNRWPGLEMPEGLS